MKQRGFTLIEMMIVVAILGILASLIAPIVGTIDFSLGEGMLSAYEIGALVFVLFAGVAIISAMQRLRTIRKNKEAADRRWEELNKRHERKFTTSPKRSSNYAQAVGTKYQTQKVAPNSVGVQAGRDVTYTSPGNITDDLVTSLILNQVLHSHSGAVSAKVDYDSGSVTMREEPSYSSSNSDDDSASRKSSYSSSYSSSDDNSSSRSSYSSSYSSSSSDSSYSSSSSDSSYSSSSSD